MRVRKRTAVVLEPLQALLATCTNGVRGIRDRALLLLAWSGGGRRRSEVVGISVNDVRPLDADTWIYTFGATKTDTSGVRREKPLRGAAAQALTAWLETAQPHLGHCSGGCTKGAKSVETGCQEIRWQGLFSVARNLRDLRVTGQRTACDQAS